jgi:hypothetical protein
MMTKMITEKIRQLDYRLKRLERRRNLSATSTLDTLKRTPAQRKQAEKIFAETYGMISKKRGKEWLRLIEQGRNSWK